MMTNTKIFPLVGVLIAVALVALFFIMQNQSNISSAGNVIKTITIGETRIEAEVVDTIEKLTLGLSGRESLEEGKGMLFVFESESDWGFWMKDMQFSVDILWASTDGTIIAIAKDISPDTYPEDTYSPEEPWALYVLEVPAGFVDRQGIADGMKIVVQ